MQKSRFWRKRVKVMRPPLQTMRAALMRFVCIFPTFARALLHRRREPRAGRIGERPFAFCGFRTRSLTQPECGWVATISEILGGPAEGVFKIGKLGPE